MATGLFLIASILFIAAGPGLAFAMSIRHAKPRLTIGALMVVIAVLALAFAMLSWQGAASLVGLWLLYSLPIVLVGAYVPRRWDLSLIGCWVVPIVVGVPWLLLRLAD